MDDNKKSTTIWLRPSVISRMDGWLEADNCQSRSEFVDKALRFYMGYLGTEDNTTYISRAILTAIQGTLDDNNNRLCRILFKCAVELNMHGRRRGAQKAAPACWTHRTHCWLNPS